jgi:hypothetical protein
VPDAIDVEVAADAPDCLAIDFLFVAALDFAPAFPMPASMTSPFMVRIALDANHLLSAGLIRETTSRHRARASD